MSNRINLLTFQFDRHGGGFVVEICNCSEKGATTYWGKKIEPNKITAHDLSIRKRIQSDMDSPNSSTDEWFRYDRKYPIESGDIYKSVCNDLLSKFDVAEEYWENGEISSY